jgi:hypothetical protein
VLNLVSVLPQVEAMAEQVAASLPAEEIARILQRNSELEAFRAKYGVQFTRETFTLNRPGEDGTFVLKPDGNYPLPPLGCVVKVNGYHGETWATTVTDIDCVACTYTVVIKDA